MSIEKNAGKETFEETEFPEEGEEPAPPDEMDAMMDQYLDRMADTQSVGQLITAPVVSIREEYVLVDIGDKSEGAINLKEFTENGIPVPVKGDVLEVIVKGQDSETGLMILSHAEARRRRATEKIREAVKNETPVEGKITRAVKGGLIVDIGTTAFLPASQIDTRRTIDLESWIGKDVKCAVIEYLPQKNRIILSRRKLVEVDERLARDEVFDRIKAGTTIEGVVKRIVDFGAFVDLNGIDGLIPRSEVSWNRTARPEDRLKAGDKVEVKVIDIDKERGKITLSRRQLTPDPWSYAAEKYPVGATVAGEVVSITNYGAFVRLEEGLDGMIHVTDMAWDSGGKQPSAFVEQGQQTQAIVLSLDQAGRRMSLGLKQLTTDPWEGIQNRFPLNHPRKGKVTGVTKYGAFIEMEPGIEGMVHASDMSWDKRPQQPRDMFKVDDEVEFCALNFDFGQRRISLGVKQLSESPIVKYAGKHRVGQVVEGEVIKVTEFGVFVKLEDGIEGFIHISQLDTTRVEKPGAIFKEGDKASAEIAKIDFDMGRVSLNRKTYLKKQERRDIAQYKDLGGNAGTNLGELLSEISLDDKKK